MNSFFRACLRQSSHRFTSQNYPCIVSWFRSSLFDIRRFGFRRRLIERWLHFLPLIGWRDRRRVFGELSFDPLHSLSLFLVSSYRVEFIQLALDHKPLNLGQGFPGIVVIKTSSMSLQCQTVTFVVQISLLLTMFPRLCLKQHFRKMCCLISTLEDM